MNAKTKGKNDKKKQEKENPKKLRQKETEEERLKKIDLQQSEKYVLTSFLINYVLYKKKKVVMMNHFLKIIIKK